MKRLNKIIIRTFVIVKFEIYAQSHFYPTIYTECVKD